MSLGITVPAGVVGALALLTGLRPLQRSAADCGLPGLRARIGNAQEHRFRSEVGRLPT